MSPLALFLSSTVMVIFFLFSVGLVHFVVLNSELTPRRKRLFWGLAILSVAAKLALATVGHNYDVDCWKVVTGLMEKGLDVYGNTPRWSYGPALFPAMAGLDGIAHGLSDQSGEAIHQLGPNTVETLHLAVAAFLATVDVLMALVLLSAYSYSASIVYLLSPVSLVISGFHSQLDVVAVFIALLAWLLIRDGKPTTYHWLGSAALIGVSLASKHILIFFPIWLLFWKPLGKLPVRIAYAAVAYGLFFGSFLPWMFDPRTRAGVVNDIFAYNSFYGNALLGQVTGWFVSIKSIDALLAWLPINGFKAIWMGLMGIIGIFAARRKTGDLFLLYIMAMFALSVAIADQYLAIPMIAAAIYWRAWPSWAFMASAVIALFCSPVELFRAEGSALSVTAQFFFETSNLGYRCAVIGSQLCMLGLLVVVWLNRETIEARLSTPVQAMRAALLFAAGCVPALVQQAARI